MVVIGLMSVLGTLITSMVISTLRTNVGTRARLADVDNVRVAMDSMTKTLRTAIAPAQLGATCPDCDTAFLEFSPSVPLAPCSVTFYANLGTPGGTVDRPVKIIYAVEPHAVDPVADLVEYRQRPDGTSGVASSWGANPVIRRVLVNGLAFDSSRFGSGPGCATGTAADPIFRYISSAGAPTTDVGAVHAVDITLPVRTPNALHNATTSAHTTVFLPNSAWGR